MAIGTVGVVGLGKMGGPLARHVREKGYSVIGCDVDNAAVEAAMKDGIAIAADCADLAARCDLAIVGVGFDSEVEEVVFGAHGLLAGAKDGLIIAIASTAAPQTVKDIAARAGDRKVTFLDIPMCRGEQAAVDGRLLIMGGGDKRTFEECRPVFEAFSDSIHWLGELGAGEVGKMVNNLILWSCISANLEAMKLAGALGVHGEALRQALLDSSAANWALETQIHKAPMPWAEKDMTIVLKEADNARLSLPLCGSVREVIKGIKIELGQGMPRER
jgi:3-hydroxyisobutyrate dehydrogenase-like beta-hydroxyacid dehydrogenase